ncbi:MAG: chitobiase/beta-hexosaminidase C-terminal domain-containing protein [Lachnospiraceae bacterium]|jgi:uncharacterized Zn finger protein (UPF0148 family)|nr:chitobiase/beta-hexosaminidase C-terminal domain-containing protein [Lachnospiraceae bacterium]MCI1327504.1 chitobiase/beta-hexosaminidase C-terminal domain-containing protein [Lachnospiraceae bacterium]
MRTCENCGAPIPDGELFCPKCGAEVHLVPDYETMESRVRENQMHEEEARAREEEKERIAREEALEKKNRRRKIRTIVIVCILAAAAIALVSAILVSRNRESSFEYQYQQAKEAYDAKNYDVALDHVEKALKLKKTDENAEYLLGLIYEGQSDDTNAITAYETLIGDHNDFEKGYDRIIPLYVKTEDYDALQTLLDNCRSSSILEKYADYRTYEPAFSVKEGSYSSAQDVKITCEGDGDIVYTTDGTDPTASSQVYQSAIRLASSGKTTIKARYISKKGIPGKVAEASYTIKINKADAPVITPASGTYSSTESMKITVDVPDGYRAYYSFDARATKNSTLYTSPVSMKEGSHIFYAVLVDANGNESDVASATYVYSQVTATPTPTQKPQSAIAVQTPSAATATPTPTPTPTAEPTPTESSGETDEEWDPGM